jgi:lipopolysaccharide export system permease protein
LSAPIVKDVGMPRTLYAYILKDLIKQLVTITAVMVVVLSFAVAIEPISEGLLGPASLVKVVLFSLPGMLPFALPFASALAGTLVFSRIASDNEITAALACGIGYHSLMAPVVALGTVLTISVFVLSNWVVPVFWQEVEQELGEDIVQMMVKQIQNGKTIQLGSNLLVYADRAGMEPVEASSTDRGPIPYSRLILEGVAVGEMQAPEGAPRGTPRQLQDAHTARRAVIELYRDDDLGRVHATMLLRDVSVRDRASKRFVFASEQAINPIEIPTPIQQDPQFMSWPDLKRLLAEPKRSAKVRAAHRKLAEAVAAQKLMDRVLADAQRTSKGVTQASSIDEARQGVAGGRKGIAPAQGSNVIVLTRAGGVSFRLDVPKWQRGERALVMLGDGRTKIKVLVERNGRVTQELLAERGTLTPTHKNTDAEPRLNLRLEDVTITVTSLRDTQARKNERVEPMLQYEPAGRLTPLESGIDQLLIRSESMPSTVLNAPRDALRAEVSGLQHHITSLLHARGAVAVSCVLVLALGALMVILLRRQVPLVVFFWCFLPTILAFLSIHEGSNMLEHRNISAAAGLAMLWSGNGLLAALVLGTFVRLNRN